MGFKKQNRVSTAHMRAQGCTNVLYQTLCTIYEWRSDSVCCVEWRASRLKILYCWYLRCRLPTRIYYSYVIKLSVCFFFFQKAEFWYFWLSQYHYTSMSPLPRFNRPSSVNRTSRYDSWEYFREKSTEILWWHWNVGIDNRFGNESTGNKGQRSV